VLAFGYPLTTALTVGASPAQIGEFYFILAGLGRSLDLLPAEGQSLILAAALISISLNSFVFTAVEPARRLEQSHDPLAELPATVDQAKLSGHVVLAGYGRVGRRIAETLAGRNIPVGVIEENRELAEELGARGIPSVTGNAGEPAVLI
jgi:monovalent cation:H+ antiporter-2, CPA2 family